jgi:N-acetyl-anhydromuramyl-L-alanine amidase AmpD
MSFLAIRTISPSTVLYFDRGCKNLVEILDCILDDKNEFPIGVRTLGARIAKSGKKRLWENRDGGLIDTVVIHYISAVNISRFQPYHTEHILKIFYKYGVSSHYLITRMGKVYRLVPEKAKAWHCGPSIMPEPDNREGVNDFSIGIELVSTHESGFSRYQYNVLCELCRDIEKRYGREMKYVGHDQVAGERAVAMKLREEPKIDPGPKFNWEYFFKTLRG